MRTDPRQKISPDDMAWVFERIDQGVPLKALAVDLGVDVVTLQRRIIRAEREGLDAFRHPALRYRKLCAIVSRTSTKKGPEPMIHELIEKGALFVVSHSGGKDSQAMMVHLTKSGVPASQMVVIHADLGHVEWDGAKDIARRNAEAVGAPFIVATARRGLLQMVKERFEKRPEVPSWPSSSTRQCTSDLKRGPIAREARRYATANGFTLVLNCMGFRSEESPARAKRPVLAAVKSNTTKTRDWFDFLPILDWNTQQVFQTIADDGQRPHHAYGANKVAGRWVAEGNDRLSCVFCIMASAKDIAHGAQERPELAAEYIAMEDSTGYTMHMSRKPLRQIIAEGRADLISTAEVA